MKKTIIFMMIILCTSVFAQDLSKYEFERDVKVDCDEFIGYGMIDVDNDLMQKTHLLSDLYLDSEYYVVRGGESLTRDWFIQDSNINNIAGLKSLVDGNFKTSYSLEKPNNVLKVTLKNPHTQTFNKIKINIADSELTNVIFKNKGSELNVRQIKSGFEYVYLLDEQVQTNGIEIELYFTNILKVKEISLSSFQKSSISFLIDNECSRTYKMYYGGYGGSFASYRKTQFPADTQANLAGEIANLEYNLDFDGDKVANNRDNCINTPNADQKDINYNGIGDSCDDFDRDGKMNDEDNCPDIPNRNQLDSDKDGFGDVCDEEDDRFSEKNSWLFYILGFFAVGLFIFFAIKMIKNN